MAGATRRCASDPQRGRTYTARCAESHDLCVAKLIAGRPKDREFVAALLAGGHVNKATIVLRLAVTDVDDDERATMLDRLHAWAGS